MKLKKVKILIALIISFCFASMVNPAEAAYLVSMTQSGNKYIYSNNPESIQGTMVSSSPYGKYTIDQPLQSSTTYVAEFYHHNYTGDSLRVGIAIKNNNSYTANVRVQNKAILAGQYTLETSTSVLRDFGNSTNDQTISIPANSTVTILYTDVPTQYIVNGKVKFTPQAGNMNARVFFISTSKYNVNNIFSLPRATSANSSMTTAFFNYDTRTVNVNAATTPSFYLSAYQDNPGEYETGTNVLGSSKLLGNYGIVYDVYLSNAAGKRIKITPNLASQGATQAQIVLWTASNSWYRTTYVNRSSSQPYWLMSVPSDGHFKFTLPGGNFGNVLFEIIN
ncbi:hypothetical protein GFC29_3111 [Anoxybacillus sp. B7M1]|uniref:hypothetical protein n=1 Tax=unclassified Anoxybacillus TaxID=2639704 RepID=UPI0005CD43DB|nr:MULTISPECIES: hypothetical protein [unclassified Anoxybacillus]ANB57677.1 hypothetical protein GFC28_2325 [Anoxybacillus sp. B2M1]ANB62811.1 hypothetical protein GFC29_3111 [Anoxybacillus sp. B7M1]